MGHKSEQEILQYLMRKKDRRNELDTVFGNFNANVLPELIRLRDNNCGAKQNVYQISGARKLSAANAITRTYNTKLGLLWEKIAALAPNVVSPELEFGYKIPEVDVIVYYNNRLYYTQLKTQKNTLTGSQNKRTIAELGSFPNHWFVACIDTNCPSTIPSALNKLIGREFWSKIGIDYDNDILPNLKKSVMLVENILE